MANQGQYPDSRPEIKNNQATEVANSVPDTWKPVGSLAAQVLANAMRRGAK